MLPDGYTDMTRDEKVRYWGGVIYRNMRWAGESGADEMTVFNQRLIDGLKAADPETEQLMPSILTYVARRWLESPATFLDNVNGRLGTHYPVDRTIALAKFTLTTR